MKFIIVECNIRDVEILSDIKEFKPLYEYYNEESKPNPYEWGKIVLGEVEIVIYARSVSPYKKGQTK